MHAQERKDNWHDKHKTYTNTLKNNNLWHNTRKTNNLCMETQKKSWQESLNVIKNFMFWTTSILKISVRTNWQDEYKIDHFWANLKQFVLYHA